MDQKYYWLRLKKDFFKRHDIRIIEDMPNGKDYVLFYLKLLVESIDHDGRLRFSDTIPYKEDMLSTITNTNIDIVRSAMSIFKELGFVELLDDATIYLKEVEKLTGSETAWAEKKRQYRLQKGQCPQAVLPLSDKSKRKIKSKSKINIKKEEEIPSFIDPVVWKSFVEMRNSKKKPLTERACQQIWNKLKDCDDPNYWLDQSIENCWTTVYPKEEKSNYVQLWDGSARVPRYLCIKTERGWEEKSRVGEPSHLKGE